MILHIDMDAFYASVEQRDNPRLRGKCVIVGGTSNRGVVSAASYEARKAGVHSAMPVFQARRRCPDGIFIHPRMDRYKAVSREIMTILKTFSPRVEPVSIDEAYLDISGCSRLLGDAVEIGMAVKTAIREAVRLSCSVGIAPNRFLAKVASDMDKPDGLYLIGEEDVTAFVEALPVEKVPGVGKTTRRALEKMGIRFLGEVRKYPEEMILRRLGKYGSRLISLAYGIDETPVVETRAHKSISSEHTFSRDTGDIDTIRSAMLGQAEEVSRQLRKLDVRARTVTLKLRLVDFRRVTRSATLPVPTRSTDAIFKEAASLLNRYGLKGKIRLVGVGASGLVDAKTPAQMTLFEQKQTGKGSWEEVDRALDTIHRKFGKGAVKRARSRTE